MGKNHPISFTCPKCNLLTRTTCEDVRTFVDGRVSRRRKCMNCGHRFRTMEVIVTSHIRISANAGVSIYPKSEVIEKLKEIIRLLQGN